jgi:hypothetical protein
MNQSTFTVKATFAGISEPDNQSFPFITYAQKFSSNGQVNVRMSSAEIRNKADVDRLKETFSVGDDIVLTLALDDSCFVNELIGFTSSLPTQVL